MNSLSKQPAVALEFFEAGGKVQNVAQPDLGVLSSPRSRRGCGT